MVSFFYHDNADDETNFTDEHNSGKDVTVQTLADLGVLYLYAPSIDKVNEIAEKRKYKNRDEVILNLDTFPSMEAFNSKMRQFYKEHYHDDEEIRYIIEGEGYFDVRDKEDRWIRAKLEPHDLLVLPAGIYHRFTLTSEKKNVHAMRLFKDEPKWEAINRDSGKISTTRIAYVENMN